MPIKRINQLKNSVGYCLEDPLKIDINKFFQHLESKNYKNRQQVLGIDNVGKPARLETITKNTVTVEYNLDKSLIVIRNNNIDKQTIDEVEDILFKEMGLNIEDLSFFEYHKVELILTDNFAIDIFKKYNNAKLKGIDSIYSREFHNFNIRLTNSNIGFDNKTPLNEIKDYFEVNIAPYVPRPEYYHFQIVLRGGYKSIKGYLKEIDNKIKDTIKYIEEEN